MATPFNQAAPSFPTILNTSNCFIFGNTASGNALSVQQLGAGNVFVTSNASGRVGLFVSATSNVGVGMTNPQTTLQVSGPANTATNRATPYANAFVSVINDIFYGTTGQVGLEIGSGTRASGDNDRVYKYVFNAINNATVGAGVDFQILAIPTAPASYASDGTARNRMTIRYDGNVGIGTTNPAALLQVGSGGLCFTTAQNTNTKTVFDAGVNIINGVGYYSGFLQVQVNYGGFDRTAALLYHYCACKNVTGGNMVVNATLLNSAVTASNEFNATCTFTPASGSTFNVLLQTSGTRAGSGTVVYNATLNGIVG